MTFQLTTLRQSAELSLNAPRTLCRVIRLHGTLLLFLVEDEVRAPTACIPAQGAKSLFSAGQTCNSLLETHRRPIITVSQLETHRQPVITVSQLETHRQPMVTVSQLETHRQPMVTVGVVNTHDLVHCESSACEWK